MTMWNSAGTVKQSQDSPPDLSTPAKHTAATLLENDDLDSFF